MRSPSTSNCSSCRRAAQPLSPNCTAVCKQRFCGELPIKAAHFGRRQGDADCLTHRLLAGGNPRLRELIFIVQIAPARMAASLKHGKRGGGVVVTRLDRQRDDGRQPVPVAEAVTFSDSDQQIDGRLQQRVGFLKVSSGEGGPTSQRVTEYHCGAQQSGGFPAQALGQATRLGYPAGEQKCLQGSIGDDEPHVGGVKRPDRQGVCAFGGNHRVAWAGLRWRHHGPRRPPWWRPHRAPSSPSR